MPADPAGTFQIQLRLEGSMPSGVACGPGGSAREFTGWVGLIAAVDALAAGEGDTVNEEEER